MKTFKMMEMVSASLVTLVVGIIMIVEKAPTYIGFGTIYMTFLLTLIILNLKSQDFKKEVR